MRKWFITLVMLAAVHQINAAPTFSITPTAISNTYAGTITLQISALTPGDTVVVQKFLDANTNGVLDAPDFLVQQFKLTDGQPGMVIGGVTNINVPGDTDTTAGQITAKLNYPDRNFVQSIIGKYLFVLSSPAGHFTPITNAFSVTNFPFAQTISGTVFSNSAPVSNAIVIIFPAPNGHDLGTPVAGAVANNSGAYRVQMPPGIYVPLAVKSNYLGNYSTAPVLTLDSSQTISTNLTLTNTTATISGKVVDANNASIGLPGLFLPATGANSVGNNLIAIAFTDTNGNFNIRVGSGTWSISGDASGSLNVLGYVGYDNNTNIAAGATGVVLPLYKATAIFYGTVKDNLGNPLPGVAVFASDNNSIYSSDGISDVNGNYVATALGGLSGVQWQVQEDFGGPPNYIYSQGDYGVTLSTGQAYPYNFTALLAVNSLSGNVQFNGTNVVGVGVSASATIDGIQFNSSADTDANGNYSFNVATGDWSVNVNCSGGSDSLENILGSGNYQCPNSQNVTIINNNSTANFTIFPPNSGQIFGYIADAYGNPVVGVNVYASDGLGDSYSTATDGGGYYSLGVINGNYGVILDCGQLNSLGYQCVSTNYVSVLDDSAEADFNVQFITTPTYSFATVYGFSAAATDVNGLTTNSDGAFPYSGLVLSGNTLYGTAAYGGTNGAGTVFAVNTNITSFAVVHTFSTVSANSIGIYTNSDGGVAGGDLVLSGGTLYGMAEYGGTNGNGTVFAVNTNGTGLRILHTFTALDAATGTTNGDGAYPYAGLILSGSTLYGTAEFGGTNGNGTVFAVNTNGTGFRIVHTFTALDQTYYTNSDGANPLAGLILSGSTLYSTAGYGGTNGYGTIFKVNTNGSGFTALYSFTDGNDGANPYAGLILSSNILYGTANLGGMWGSGTVFAVNTNGTGFTVLHNFTGGDDGSQPYAGLTLSASNVLFGTATYGGSAYNGTVFEVSTNGTNFTVLHSFTGGNDGAYPAADLILTNNILYGTASGGGTNGSGTVFAVSITPLPPAPMFLPPVLFSNGQVQMTVTGSANQNYTVQMSTNLISTNWIPLLITNPSGSSFLFSDPHATNKERFYRIWVGP